MSAIHAEAVELGVASRFILLGALPRMVLFERARQADLGIVLFADAMKIPMVGASVKPFDYLGCGLPLLVNDSEEWKLFYVDKGVAKSADPASANEIATAINWYYEKPALCRKMTKQGHRLILSEWKYDWQFQKIVEKLHLSTGKIGQST